MVCHQGLINYVRTVDNNTNQIKTRCKTNSPPAPHPPPPPPQPWPLHSCRSPRPSARCARPRCPGGARPRGKGKGARGKWLGRPGADAISFLSNSPASFFPILQMAQAPGRERGRGRGRAARSASPPPIVRGRGRGHGRGCTARSASPSPIVCGRARGRGRGCMASPSLSPPPALQDLAGFEFLVPLYVPGPDGPILAPRQVRGGAVRAGARAGPAAERWRRVGRGGLVRRRRPHVPT